MNEQGKRIGDIGSDYGGLLVKVCEGKYYWTVENWGKVFWDEIPGYLYEALVKFETERNSQPECFEPAKLVRLTEMELWRNDELMALNAEFGLLFPDVQRFANAIMDAMIAKNGGQR